MKMLLWLVVALLAGVYICTSINDPDLWWHITVGRWILAHHTLPHVDHWNLFYADKPWRAYSWSNEIVYAFADRHWPEHGLLALSLGLAMALSFTLCFFLSKISRSWFVGLLFGGFATLACFNHYTLRPQSLVWGYFIVLIYVLDRIDHEGLRVRWGVALVAIMCAWANTHITAALALLTAGCWVARRENKLLVLRVLGLCFLGTLITPYFGGEWLTFISTTGHPFSHQSIAEFKPATILQYSTAFLVIAFALLGAFVYLAPKSVPLLRVLVAGTFTLGALAVIKFLPMAVILLLSVAASIWAKNASGNALGNLGIGLEKLRVALNRIPREGLTFLFLCVTMVRVHSLWQFPLNRQVVPVDAMDFILGKHLPFPLLNAFGSGGYVMYRLSSSEGMLEQKVPIDGRTNTIPAEVWEKFMAAYLGKEDWEDYLTLTNPKTILWKRESPLVAILKAQGDWCVVHRSGDESEGFLVFVARQVFNERKGDLHSENCS